MCLLGNEKLTFHINAEDAIDLFFFDALYLAKMFNAAVGHDDINPSELLLGSLEQSDDVRLFGDISFDADGLDAKGASLFGNFLGTVRA